MPELQTERLIVVSVTPEIAHAAIGDRQSLGRLLNAMIPDNWPSQDFAGFLPILADQLDDDPDAGVWSGLILLRTNRILVGDIGFVHPSALPGTVELGYSIVQDYQGMGIATEAATAMTDWAFEQPDIQRIRANCLNDNAASIRVLEKIGMHRSGRSGPLLQWELQHDRPES